MHNDSLKTLDSIKSKAFGKIMNFFELRIC